MQLFQVVIFISHYDSSCWFLSHSSFFKGEGRCLFFKKRGMHCIMRSGIDHCCRIVHHYCGSFQFSAAESLRILFFFYTLIILLIHCPFSFNRNKGGFFFKTNRGLEMDSPTSAAIYDSLLWCRWRWWQQSFFQSTRIASLFWCIFISISSWCTLSLKENGILHHLIDSFLLLLKKKEELILLIHHDLHHYSDAFLPILMKTRLIFLIHYISFCITYPMHLFPLK